MGPKGKAWKQKSIRGILVNSWAARWEMLWIKRTQGSHKKASTIALGRWTAAKNTPTLIGHCPCGLQAQSQWVWCWSFGPGRLGGSKDRCGYQSHSRPPPRWVSHRMFPSMSTSGWSGKSVLIQRQLECGKQRKLLKFHGVLHLKSWFVRNLAQMNFK